MVKRALYLAGGGARGAYQAGILKAIGHILQAKTLPFDVVSGVSVGCINAVVLVECANDFPAALDKLESIWGEIHCQQIYKSSNFQLAKSVLRNVSAMAYKPRQSGFLLDTTPFHQLIDDNIDFSKISLNIQKGHIDVFEVLTSCYETHQTVSFYQQRNLDFEDWHYPRHSSKKASLQTEHILASSALPLFFPSVEIDSLHYGDGSMGLIAPLRGAIRFNVDKIMVLGTRESINLQQSPPTPIKDIPFSHVLGTMLNGLFLDNLDRDIEMVNRMNDIATLLSIWKKHRSPWRPIETMYLRPSQSMAQLAQEHYRAMPALLRYLLNILGAKNRSGDLLSFLLFEKEYTRILIQMGFEDTIAKASDIEAFFN